MEMLSKLGARRPTLAVVRCAYRTANVIFVGAMISTVASWGLLSDTSSAGWAFAYTLMSALMIAVMLVLFLLVHAVAERTIAFLKWPFVLFVLLYVVFSVSGAVGGRWSGSDTVRLHLLNESGETIEGVDIFGRGEMVRVDSIAAGSAVVVPYRGRNINYQSGDDSSNRIGVSWLAAGRRRERILIERWTVFGDSLIFVFPAPDSVQVAGPRAAVIAK